MPPIDEIEVIAPHFKRRLSGVTSTVIQLVPRQVASGLSIATLGPGLPAHLPKLRYANLLKCWRLPKTGKTRIWHARRNVEMLAGLALRDLLRMPMKLVFTSASQRKHSGWTRFLVSRMDGVIATSQKTATYLTVPNTVVMHGIDTTRFHPADRTKVRKALGLPADMKAIGCFGRVRHQKGTDLFVDALIDLLPANPGWIGIVAGRATPEHQSFETELRERVAKAGLSERILFVGEHTNIDEWYRTLDLFVAPQRWEGFGLTPLEAMASGVPVVAADVGAFSEIIVPGRTGSIIGIDDLQAMKAEIALYMKDDLRRLSHGEHARDHVVRNFDLDREVEGLSRVYASVWESGR